MNDRQHFHDMFRLSTSGEHVKMDTQVLLNCFSSCHRQDLGRSKRSRIGDSNLSHRKIVCKSYILEGEIGVRVDDAPWVTHYYEHQPLRGETHSYHCTLSVVQTLQNTWNISSINTCSFPILQRCFYFYSKLARVWPRILVQTSLLKNFFVTTSRWSIHPHYFGVVAKIRGV